jgi:hypothetical protein
MKLFGWKAAREAARPVLARAGYAGAISRIGLGVIGGGAAAGAFPQGYEAQLREGYLANAVAQRAVRVVADAVAGVPVKVVGAPGDKNTCTYAFYTPIIRINDLNLTMWYGGNVANGVAQ